MEDAGLAIELIEQPVKAADFEGLKQVTDHVDTLIMADESAFSPADVFRLLSMRACDLINIKLMKAGGLGPASKIAAMAEAAGVECMMGCMLECKIGITAAAALSAGTAVITKNDLDAADLMAADPFRAALPMMRTISPLGHAGLGIQGVEGWTLFKGRVRLFLLTRWLTFFIIKKVSYSLLRNPSGLCSRSEGFLYDESIYESRRIHAFTKKTVD